MAFGGERRLQQSSARSRPDALALQTEEADAAADEVASAEDVAVAVEEEEETVEAVEVAAVASVRRPPSLG